MGYIWVTKIRPFFLKAKSGFEERAKQASSRVSIISVWRLHSGGRHLSGRTLFLEKTHPCNPYRTLSHKSIPYRRIGVGQSLEQIR